MDMVSRQFLSQLFSSGGDEVNSNCYALDSETQAQLNATGSSQDGALDDFLHSIHGALRANGKTPIVKEGVSTNTVTGARTR